jgi:hypothetical protein
VFALQEGHLERLVRNILWEPLKRIGQNLNRINVWLKALVGLALIGLIAVVMATGNIDGNTYAAIPVSFCMVLVSLSAFSQKRSPFKVWNGVALSSSLAGVAVWLMNPQALNDVLLFLTGIIPAWLLGILVLSRILKQDNFAENPFIYRAVAETHPGLSLLLFLSFLGLVGFPITPAFLGEDLLLSHASSHHPWFAAPITIAFVVNGIAIARVFLRLCMGRPSEVCN